MCFLYAFLAILCSGKNYSGPGNVGSKNPIIVAVIHTIAAITSTLSHPML
jgi:hypothetical protein